MKKLAFLLIIIQSLTSWSDNYNFKQAEFKREHIKKMSAVAPVWEGYTNSDGTGLYWEVIKSIYEPVGIKVKVKNIPWNRAMKMVTKYRTYNSIIGEYRDSEENLIFPNYPIDVEYMSVLSKSNTPMFNGYESLTGKKVGWIKDYEVIPESRRNFSLKEFRDIEQGIKLLESGKIDYLIEEGDEIESAIEKLSLSPEEYKVAEMPEGTDVYMGFSVDNLSRELIEIYNERVYDLVENGKMAAIYKKWGHDEMPEMLQAITIIEQDN